VRSEIGLAVPALCTLYTSCRKGSQPGEMTVRGGPGTLPYPSWLGRCRSISLCLSTTTHSLENAVFPQLAAVSDMYGMLPIERGDSDQIASSLGSQG